MVRRSVVGKYSTVQCREAKTGQQKVQPYYEDDPLCPSTVCLMLNSLYIPMVTLLSISCTQMLLLHERILFEDFVACRRPPPPVSEDHPSSSPLLSDPSPPLGSPFLHPSVPLSLSNPTEQFRGFQQQKRRTRNLSYELSVHIAGLSHAASCSHC